MPARARSRWPPVLRWLDAFSLEWLERLVLRSPRLQRFVLARTNARSARCSPRAAASRRVTIVGGGLFPRTALILRRLLPDAALTIVDAQRASTSRRRGRFVDGRRAAARGCSMPATSPTTPISLVIPLAFIGDRDAVYDHPPAPAVLVHDWIWRPRAATGAPVSWLLLKRLNLVAR